jgi:hypothetical protein
VSSLRSGPGWQRAEEKTPNEPPHCAGLVPPPPASTLKMSEEDIRKEDDFISLNTLRPAYLNMATVAYPQMGVARRGVDRWGTAEREPVTEPRKRCRTALAHLGLIRVRWLDHGLLPQEQLRIIHVLETEPATGNPHRLERPKIGAPLERRVAHSSGRLADSVPGGGDCRPASFCCALVDGPYLAP